MNKKCKDTSVFIKGARKKTGLTQKSFAKLIPGLTQPKVAQYESGDVCPPGNIILAIASLFEKNDIATLF